MIAAPAHDYLSTACLHNSHEQCRLICKFCPASCRCACHDPDKETPDDPVQGRPV